MLDHAVESRGGATIELIDVTKTYPGQLTPAVDRVNLTVPAGEIVCLVGPSGCGKTTTMKLINRLIEPTSGEIRVGGVNTRKQSPDQLRRGIGYVIQHGGLFPHYTVAQNVAVVPRMLGWPKPKTTERVAELLELVGLDHGTFAKRYPAQLSGGQQQRVGVARALAADPPVLLMDEPFGAVDPVTRARLQDELSRINQALGKTIVFVTHDMDEALKLGDRIAVLGRGASVTQYAPPSEILASPADDSVAEFIGDDTGVKLLRFTPLAGVALDEHPTASADATVAELTARWPEESPARILVLANDQPTGWLFSGSLAKAEPATRVADLASPLGATLSTATTLQGALYQLLSDGHETLPVTEDGEYRGVVSLSTVQRAMLSLRVQPRGQP